MEDSAILLERCEQRIKALERDVRELKAVQAEIRSMNEALVMLATELKHTNEHLMRHEEQLQEINCRPGVQLQQIITAAASALAGGFVSSLLARLFG